MYLKELWRKVLTHFIALYFYCNEENSLIEIEEKILHIYIIECQMCLFLLIHLFLMILIDLFHWRKSLLSVCTHTLYMHSRKQHTLYLHRLKVTSVSLSVKLLQSQADRKRQRFEETGFKVCSDFVFSSSEISYKKKEKRSSSW